jgi:hypothetical protein
LQHGFIRGDEMSEHFDPSKVKPVEYADVGCNVSNEIIMAQTAANIRRQLPQAQPHAPNGEVVALVCGGPSLKDTETDLVEAYWKGAKVVCVNGSYQWCIDRNIRPSCVVILDAREFNARFIETPVPGCRYLLASQCHPKVFELCADRDVTIWHACSACEPELELLNAFYFKHCFPITTGTTVAIRAIALMRMLGFQSFDIYGLDSCWLDGAHHTYSQPENNRDNRYATWLRPEGRDDLACRFECAPWHMKQAEDFEELMREYGHLFRLNVRGNGLIAAMMRIAGELGSIPKPESEQAYKE